MHQDWRSTLSRVYALIGVFSLKHVLVVVEIRHCYLLLLHVIRRGRAIHYCVVCCLGGGLFGVDLEDSHFDVGGVDVSTMLHEHGC